MLFSISDSDWSVIEGLLPQRRRRARVDDRKVISAILFILQTGTPWRDLPKSYGPYTTAFNRFNRWSRRGVWKRIAEQLGKEALHNICPAYGTVISDLRDPRGRKRGRRQWRAGTQSARQEHTVVRNDGSQSSLR